MSRPLDPTPPKDPAPTRPRFQFGLRTLLLITVMVSVLSAALAGMLRGRFRAPMPPGFFELMAAAAPVALLLVVSLIYSAARHLGRRR